MRHSPFSALTWCTVLAAVLSALWLALDEGDPAPNLRPTASLAR